MVNSYGTWLYGVYGPFGKIVVMNYISKYKILVMISVKDKGCIVLNGM